MYLSPQLFRLILNIYSPYLGAGIHTDSISTDWRRIRLSMQLRWYNRNAVGTHFGGSLYSMVDPHPMLMLMNLLGQEYIVRDRSAAIEFLRPGRGKVHADIAVTDAELSQIRINTKGGGRYLPCHSSRSTSRTTRGKRWPGSRKPSISKERQAE